MVVFAFGIPAYAISFRNFPWMRPDIKFPLIGVLLVTKVLFKAKDVGLVSNWVQVEFDEMFGQTASCCAFPSNFYLRIW